VEKYHLRRKDKAIEDEGQMLDFLEGQEFATIALSNKDSPYLFTADYGLDRNSRTIFLHCASKGKKVDYIRENPQIWGQVMEDMGYAQGECDHKYRTVQFWGKASLVTDMEEKRKALCVMIDQLEEDNETEKKEFIQGKEFENVMIIRIDIEGLSGKESLPAKVG
jgi:uncharacterized protein